MANWQRTEHLLIQGINATALRHRVLAHNVANANTPGFKRADVSFPKQLQAQMRLVGTRTHSQHLVLGRRPQAELKLQVVQEHQTTMRNDRNNVDIDLEMARVAENTLLHNTFLELLNRNYAGLKMILREAR